MRSFSSKDKEDDESLPDEATTCEDVLASFYTKANLLKGAYPNTNNTPGDKTPVDTKEKAA